LTGIVSATTPGTVGWLQRIPTITATVAAPDTAQSKVRKCRIDTKSAISFDEAGLYPPRLGRLHPLAHRGSDDPRRINRLIDDVLADPFEGIGKPEQLRQALAGAWSRHISEKHRLVYLVDGNDVVILQARYHH